MRTYHVDIEHSQFPETVNCANAEEAKALFNETLAKGKNASAYYMEDGKVFDAFTGEEIVTKDL